MNARTGRLSQRDVERIQGVRDLLNQWIDAQEERGLSADEDYALSTACTAVVAMNDFVSEYVNR